METVYKAVLLRYIPQKMKAMEFAITASTVKLMTPTF